MHRDAMAGEKRQLRRAAGKSLERSEAMQCRKLANRVHFLVKVERREARPAIANFSKPQSDLCADVRERITGHALPPE
jgi:hypothetical protein